MESRKPCANCRGKSIVWESNDLHENRRSKRASGEPRSSSPKKHSPECSKFRRVAEEETRDEIASCAEKFSLAKRLHAENLQHQPLPDRVDDTVFRNGYRSCSASCERDEDRANAATRTARTTVDRLFGPSLGCKKPKTRMDLAICWETPIDPVYEPRRATHIDGTEGGSAPAIFALIQHTPAPRSRELLSRCGEKGGCGCAGRDEAKNSPSGNGAGKSRCRCDCSCESRGDRRSGKLPRSNSLPRITERRCAACRGGELPETELERRRRDPRLIRSAVGVVLGLEERATGDEGARRNGLPPRMTVPRPRTPFARRAFCIDTLAPPFSVVNGCRDADYPEHWRLMSVYQQSYRNPQKRRTRRF